MLKHLETSSTPLTLARFAVDSLPYRIYCKKILRTPFAYSTEKRSDFSMVCISISANLMTFVDSSLSNESCIYFLNAASFEVISRILSSRSFAAFLKI
jgi:hypothetical protein